MNEVAFNRIIGEDGARFTFTRKQMLDSFTRRADKYGANYEVNNHFIDGDWDTAVVWVDSDDLRPMRYLIKAQGRNTENGKT